MDFDTDKYPAHQTPEQGEDILISDGKRWVVGYYGVGPESDEPDYYAVDQYQGTEHLWECVCWTRILHTPEY